jgi:hypothetical protein
MKYILLFLVALNVYANPCDDHIRVVKSNNDTFNRIQQQNLEENALLCQQYEINKAQKSIQYLDKQIRDHYIIP